MGKELNSLGIILVLTVHIAYIFRQYLEEK